MKINKNLLFTISFLTIVISFIVGYSYLNSDINSTSNVTVNKYNCNQTNLYDRLACISVMDNVKSKYVSSSTGINFSTISSDTNGKGIYTFSSTAGDEYPIHYYKGYKRREESTPSLKCSNKNDSFTESDMTKGNGKLTYRVGLITADEVIIAGGINSENSDYYLRNKTTFWTMTPYKFDKNWGGTFGLYSNGKLDYHGIGDSKGVRPMISLNHSQVIASGDGTQNNPYVIN